MALISCLTSPDGQQDVFSCLRTGQGLSGFLVLIILLVGWLVIQYLAEARRVRRTREARPGIPVPPAQFGNARHATAVHEFANREYYQILLAKLEKSLTDEGYALTREELLRVTLPEAVRQKISRRIVRARQYYTTPRVSEQMVIDSEDAAVNDGYAGTWLHVLIRGSESVGWYITKPEPEFTPTSFPLKQVVITVRATQAVLTRDVVRIINEIAEKVKNQPSHSFKTEGIAADAINSELNYEAHQREVAEAPGWFNSPTGCDVPDDITEGQFPPVRMSGYRHFIVRAQGGAVLYRENPGLLY